MAQQKKMGDVINAVSRKYAEMQSGDAGTAGIPLMAWLAALLIVLAGFGVHWLVHGRWEPLDLRIIVPTILVAVYVLLALKIARQWDRAVVLRLGKFHRLKGPGMFFIIPIVESIAQGVDMRIRATDFSSESTLTNTTALF